MSRTPRPLPALASPLARHFRTLGQDMHLSPEPDRSIGSMPVFDHVAINVDDMAVSRRFFEEALAPLGYPISFDSPEWVGMQAVAETISGSSAETR